MTHFWITIDLNGIHFVFQNVTYFLNGIYIFYK